MVNVYDPSDKYGKTINLARIPEFKMELEFSRATSTFPKQYKRNVMDGEPERARMGIVLHTDSEPAMAVAVADEVDIS